MSRLRVISMKEIKIQRKGADAIFIFHDPSQGSIQMRIGSRIKKMSDKKILALYNEGVRARQRMAQNTQHVAIETVGAPQIRFREDCQTWVSEGDILRCRIDWREPGEPCIIIDDHELSFKEFGDLLLTHEGWGMRITFVPEDELHKVPPIQLNSDKD